MVSQMEAQQADAGAKEELLLELTSKNTTRSIKDFSPEGIRLESNLEGEAKGVYNATFYATITMLVKPDRTIDYEARQIHTTSDARRSSCTTRAAASSKAPPTISSWAKPPSRPHQRSSHG
jgi:hypothetical protein